MVFDQYVSLSNISKLSTTKLPFKIVELYGMPENLNMIIELNISLHLAYFYFTDDQFTFYLHVTITILVVSLEEGLKRLRRDLESRGQLFPLFKPLPTPKGVCPCPTRLAYLCLHV